MKIKNTLTKYILILSLSFLFKNCSIIGAITDANIYKEELEKNKKFNKKQVKYFYVGLDNIKNKNQIIEKYGIPTKQLEFNNIEILRYVLKSEVYTSGYSTGVTQTRFQNRRPLGGVSAISNQTGSSESKSELVEQYIEFKLDKEDNVIDYKTNAEPRVTYPVYKLSGFWIGFGIDMVAAVVIGLAVGGAF